MILRVIIMATLMIALQSCDKGPEPEPAEQSYDLTLKINHLWKGGPMIFDDLSLTNAADNVISIVTFKYLMSQFQLQKSNGEWISFPNKFAYMNPKEGRETVTIKDIPEGQYTSLKFTIGLEESVNKGDPGQYGSTHPLNPLLNLLHWSWSDGYVFLSMEGAYVDGSSGTSGYSYHIAFEENLMPIEVPGASINLNGNKTVEIDFEAHEAWTNPEDFNIAVRGEVSHSGADGGIANTFRDNVKDAFSW